VQRPTSRGIEGKNKNIEKKMESDRWDLLAVTQRARWSKDRWDPFCSDLKGMIDILSVRCHM
jgi:hypothetical protein